MRFFFEGSLSHLPLSNDNIYIRVNRTAIILLILHQANWAVLLFLLLLFGLIIIHITRSACAILSLFNEFILHINVKKEKKLSEPCVHIYYLAVIDKRIVPFARWLYIWDRFINRREWEKEKSMKSSRDRKMRQQVWWWSLCKMYVHTEFEWGFFMYMWHEEIIS